MAAGSLWRRGTERLAPELARFPVMFQNWSQISFLHWRCSPAVLQPRLPAGLVIDTFKNEAWVGLTPFHLTGLRPPCLPALPWVSAFPEMNLRTYVRGPAGPGVWFFSLDAASLAAVLGARLTYGLPYYWAAMQIQTAGRQVHYTSARARAEAAITVEVGEPLAEPGALALFLTERYRLYTLFLGRLAVASVAHHSWPLHRATVVHLEETVRQAADMPGDGAPAVVHYSPGVQVRVGGLRRLSGLATARPGRQRIPARGTPIPC